MFELRLLKRLDWWLLAVVLALCMIGLAAIYSASRADLLAAGRDGLLLAKRQALWLALGWAGLAVLLYPDYTTALRWRRAIYLTTCLLLVVVIALGRDAGGAVRWIQVGPLNLQPSELAKLALIVSLAGVLRRHAGHRRLPLGTLAVSGLYLAVPFVLVARQPDLGTGLVLVAVWGVMVIVAGARWQHLLAIGLTALLLFAGAWQAGAIRDYQKDRLRVFANPQADPLGAGYHVTQSRIAIGSGGWFGKGYLHGSQSQLRFIPEQHTDFIFTVVGEEGGLLAGMVVLGLCLALVWRLWRLAEGAEDSAGALLAAGTAAMFGFQGLVNIGMTLGLAPVTGLPLPFLSYGGSSLLTNLALVGLALNVGMRRQKIRW